MWSAQVFFSLKYNHKVEQILLCAVFRSPQMDWSKIYLDNSLHFIFLLLHNNAMHLGLTADTPQLPLEIIVERKNILLQSFEIILDNLDSAASNINFLWDHQALCKHQVKALIPLPLQITRTGPFNHCPSCFWCKLEEQIQIPEKVRVKIESSKIPPAKTALLSHPPSGLRKISLWENHKSTFRNYCVSQRTVPSEYDFECQPKHEQGRKLTQD